MRTLLLDVETWDLTVDLNGNIAVAENPYALAQDAASSIKTFSGECWYNTALGVQYFRDVLGLYPPASLLKESFKREALRVPEVVSAQVFLQGVKNDRQLSGQVQISDAKGNSMAVGF